MIRPLLLAAIIALLTLTAAARAADAPPRSISTTGESVIYVTPNEVTINVGVTTYNADLSEAVAANEKSAGSMLKAVKDSGAEEKNIATDNLQVQIIYKNGTISSIPAPDAETQRGIGGSLVQRGYAIKLTDTKLFDKVVQAALKHGANEMNGVAFETTDLRKYRDQARQMAAKAAKEKALALAEVLDAKVGPARTITEDANNVYFGSNTWNRRGAGNSNAEIAAPAGDATGETLPLGQIAIRANISVTFDLKD